uniref:P-type domain-containing protein n=1 Tax=Amphiprion percula TaxID=161767 RepID=A0A3P8U2L1_AMPPE
VAGNHAWLLLLIVLISLSLQTPTTVSLPLSDQRLPCGSGSVSQPQCLSMGCCFNKHPPACYYPMDGELQSVSLLAFSRHLAEYS